MEGSADKKQRTPSSTPPPGSDSDQAGIIVEPESPAKVDHDWRALQTTKAPPRAADDDHTLLGDTRNRIVNELVFLQGISATKDTLRKWSKHPWQVMRVWFFWSVVTALLLLGAVLVVAHNSLSDPSGIVVPGYNKPVHAGDVARILFRNSLVLALHGFACVAGFIAGNSLPISASKRTGFSRYIHDKAGPLAIAFVACATTFSLGTQAYFLGNLLATLSAQVHLSEFHLLLLLVPHALPELTALFLPLAAWLVASRKDDWDQLLAATFVTVAVAIPILIVTSILEVTLFPDLLRKAAGG